MVEIGHYNELEIIKFTEQGAYLNGEDLGEILLPKKYIKDTFKISDNIQIFLYKDSEDRLVATTQKPILTVGEFGYLKVKQVTKFGAFLDWGLEKDLLLPFNEQKQKVQENELCLIYVSLDENTERIIASAKINKYLDIHKPDFIEGEKVNILIADKTDLGFKVIIENNFSGLLYKNEVFTTINSGDKTFAYIKKIREDGKIDLALQQDGFRKIDKTEKLILDKLKKSKGFIEVTDKSSPTYISSLFGISKKTYKKAVGGLYKKRLIEITKNGIKLL